MSGFFDHALFLSLFTALPFCPYSEQAGDAHTHLSLGPKTLSILPPALITHTDNLSSKGFSLNFVASYSTKDTLL